MIFLGDTIAAKLFKNFCKYLTVSFKFLRKPAQSPLMSNHQLCENLERALAHLLPSLRRNRIDRPSLTRTASQCFELPEALSLQTRALASF